MGGGGAIEQILGNVQTAGGSAGIPNGGYVYLASGSTLANLVRLIGPEMFRSYTPGGTAPSHWVYFYARLALEIDSDGIIRVGIAQTAEVPGTFHFVGFEVVLSGAVTNWQFIQEYGGTNRVTTDTGIAPVVGAWEPDNEMVEFVMALNPGSGLGPCYWWLTGKSIFTSQALNTNTTAGNWAPYLSTKCDGAGSTQGVYMDKWSMWSDALR